jgi:hypothetical protein
LEPYGITDAAAQTVSWGSEKNMTGKEEQGEGGMKRDVDERRERENIQALELVRVNLVILAQPLLALLPLCCCLPTLVLITTHREKNEARSRVSQEWQQAA